MYFSSEASFIKLDIIENDIEKNIAIGIAPKKKTVKIGERAAINFKELIDSLRVITLNEQDIALIHESPQIRRTFADQAIILHDPSYAALLSKFRATLKNRNALLHQKRSIQSIKHDDLYIIWTDKLITHTRQIQECRIRYLKDLESYIQNLAHEYVGQNVHISFEYAPKNDVSACSTYELKKQNEQLLEREIILGRSLYGSHLDDMHINFSGKSSRFFASRGQQKLIVLLAKVAQLKMLVEQRGSAILLLDDFMTDFDDQVVHNITTLLKDLSIQLIFTMPTNNKFLINCFEQEERQILNL